MGIVASMMMTRNQKRKQQTESFNNAHQDATNKSGDILLQELRWLLHGGNADFTAFLPSTPTHQDEPMGRYAGPFLARLHHSADNYEPAPDSTLHLRYPSGAVERFTLSKRTHKHTHRHARPLNPIDDIVRTIQVFHIQAGKLTSSELDTMGRMIYRTFEHFINTNNFHPLQRLLNKLTHPILFPPTPPLNLPLPFDLTTHFLAQLHDRIIADAAHNLSRPSTSNTESTYGELLPPFLHKLFLQTNLNETSTYLDLGSGVGQTCLQATLTTGCQSYGIERESRSAGLAALHLGQFHERTKLWGLATTEEEKKNFDEGRIVLKLGDFLKLECVMKDWLQEADVVLVNNLKLEPETDLALVRMLSGGREGGVRAGTRVISTRPLVMVGRTRGSRVGGGKRKRGGEDECEVKRRKIEKGRMNRIGEKKKMSPPEDNNEGETMFPAVRCGEDEMWTWKEYVYEAGSVSWSDKSDFYYISVRK